MATPWPSWPRPTGRASSSARSSGPLGATESDIAPDAGDGRAPALETADWSALADDEVHRGELRAKLVEALVDLPAVYRVPALLRDIPGLTTEEASAGLRGKTQTLKCGL